MSLIWQLQAVGILVKEFLAITVAHELWSFK